MAYATYFHDGVSRVGELDGSDLIPLMGVSELGIETSIETLVCAERDESSRVATRDVTFRPVVPNPSKVFCVGLNYRDHIIETKRDVPTYPVLFPKFASSLIGPYDDIVLPPEPTQPD